MPVALQEAGVLERFYTDVYVSPAEARLLRSLLKASLAGRLAVNALSRHNPSLDFTKVVRFPKLGWQYEKALRQSASSVEAQYGAFIEYGRKFNQAIMQYGLSDSTHLYAFDHAALNLFSTSDAGGRKLVLDQIYPALHEERLEQEEEDRWPDWSLAPRSAFYHSSLFQHWRDIQLEEWRLADVVIVASRYSKRALAHTSPEIEHKLKLVPLTVNLDAYRPHQHVRRFKGERPLRVLFAGTANLRKGLPYLLRAFSEIDMSIARLTVAGGIQLSEEKIESYREHVDFLGPVPHIRMPHLYRDADVLVFPTISDGFGAVMLEAMATGLPVISTDHCGDIVEDGVNGFRIPIRSPEAIADSVNHFVRNPETLESLSAGAIRTAQRFSLANYQASLCRALDIETPAVS